VAKTNAAVLEAPKFRLLSQQIAHAVRRAILHGRYKPGERLVEHDVAALLEVSRAPVREALRQLVQEGLVIVYPHRGAVVTPVSREMVQDVFDIRERLEGLAARLAASRITPDELARLEALIDEMEQSGSAREAGLQVEQDVEFHRLVVTASGRPTLVSTLETISSKAGLLISITRHNAPLEIVAGLHRPILDALRGGDPDRAEQAAREHVEYGRGVLLRAFPGADG